MNGFEAFEQTQEQLAARIGTMEEEHRAAESSLRDLQAERFRLLADTSAELDHERLTELEARIAATTSRIEALRERTQATRSGVPAQLRALIPEVDRTRKELVAEASARYDQALEELYQHKLRYLQQAANVATAGRGVDEIHERGNRARRAAGMDEIKNWGFRERHDLTWPPAQDGEAYALRRALSIEPWAVKAAIERPDFVTGVLAQ